MKTPLSFSVNSPFTLLPRTTRAADLRVRESAWLGFGDELGRSSSNLSPSTESSHHSSSRAADKWSEAEHPDGAHIRECVDGQSRMVSAHEREGRTTDHKEVGLSPNRRPTSSVSWHCILTAGRKSVFSRVNQIYLYAH